MTGEPEAHEQARPAKRYQFDQARIRAIVDAMPPFTPEQRARLAVLLAPTSTSTS